MNRLADLLRHRVRSLSRAKVHSIAIILTFALGLGANTAMFELIDTILLRPLNFADESRLVSVGWVTRGSSWNTGYDGPQWSVFGNDIASWRRSVQSLNGIGVFGETQRTVAGDGQPEYALGGSVTSDLPRVLGTRPILGRWFTADENNTRVVVITRSLWRRQFGGDSAVVGRRLSIQQEPYTVIGVVD
ncbi:MAG TPA: ABC transporter permease, partial [Gemmatimonadaceae bacterium]|nr:ABC transporter permease [Gemmatimonadaceae bacterium]